MKFPDKPTLTLVIFLLAFSSLLFANSARAGTVSASLTPPATNGLDIANLGTATGGDKWYNDGSAQSATAAKGQTFTTGGSAAVLRAVSYKCDGATRKPATPATPTVYTIRVGTVSGTAFTQITNETFSQTFTNDPGGYITWTFARPVLLAASTTYALDVAMTSAGLAWNYMANAIPYPAYTGNNYAGGQYYDSGSAGVGGTTVIFTSARDRVFHLDLEHPMGPSPAIGASVPAGNVQLSWSNLTPSVGSDVWVDVWFGTNSGALTQVVTKGQNTTNFTVVAPGAGTYYWRMNSYLNGVSTGTPATGDLFNFVVFDSDADGIPDTYELANTTPPSATALTPGGDDDSDGLTNMQEYLLGTRANVADTDGDGLNDGAEVAGAGARPPTNPLLADTDGDGLNDSVESNTGVWVSATNTGTNPTKTDTDSDGLLDGVESNTGIYVSATNTGTSPLLADTDGDGAGDWYEVTGTFTNPNLASSKPNIPYPLPKPDTAKGATNKPVKVFILSGQSNMVGMGDVDPAGTPGTLTTVAKQQGKFPNILTTNGNWSVRSDVIYRGIISDVYNGGLGVFDSAIGPEVGFGHVMGWYLDEPVLIIKSSIGNRSLLWDCLTPGSMSFDYAGNTYAGYGQSPNYWPTNGGPSPFVWYAGKQYDDYFLNEADMGAPQWVNGTVYTASGQYVRNNNQMYTSKSAHTATAATEPGVGALWTNNWSSYSIFNVVDILDNWATQYTNWAAQGFEIAGYVWFQGNKDLGDPAAGRYETNLVNLIKHLRGYYANRYPGKCSTNTPFVVATGCGDPGTSGYGLTVANAQLAMNNTNKYPQFAGNVKTMDTRAYWRDVADSPANQGYHYNRNAETYLLTGDALGRGMIDLLAGPVVATNDYSSWATNYHGANLTDPNADADGDGVSNNSERIWGLNPTNAASRNMFKSTAGINSAGTFTYTRRTQALTSLSYTVWTSTNLTIWAQDTGAVQSPAAPVAEVETVTVTLSSGLRNLPSLFVRMRAE